VPDEYGPGIPEERFSELTRVARELAQQVDGLLAQAQALADGDEARLALLYTLLKELPVLAFEPINYAFVGRVVIPLENVLDLLIHLDAYSSGHPVRKSSSPGKIELLTLPGEIGAQAPGDGQAVTDITGIGPTYAAQLRDRAGVLTVQDLLDRGSTQGGRDELAKRTGLSEKLLSKWVRRADLMRIDGVVNGYCALLESGGVVGATDLAAYSAERLYQQLKLANSERHLVGRLPALDQVRHWIAEAQKLG
jgi:predicted flap endonuclease-1-like 5' DNA nuclease